MAADEQEPDPGWMAEVRLQRLRAAGWKGTLAEYVEAADRLGHDPLQDLTPDTKGMG